MAVRYNQKKKDEVVAFVENHNAKKGRGGQSAAVAKYKISPITISSWLKKAGSKSAGKKRSAVSKKKSVGRPAKKVAAVKVARAPKATSVSAVLKRMTAIQEQIESLQDEYSDLKKKL